LALGMCLTGNGNNQQPRPEGSGYVVLVRYLSQGTYPL
jgi:hypothetical protein